MTDRQKRDALLRECAKLEEAWKIRADEIDNDESLSDEEYDRQMRSAYDDYCKEHDKKWMQAFALKFPKRKGWFADTFVESFGVVESLRVSAKQTEVFMRYCVDCDSTWKTGNRYCRANNKLVKFTKSFKRNANYGYVTITEL